MARKPRPQLKDVFARPGQAPERNTAIEDLPREATLEATLEAAAAAAPAAAASPSPPDQPAQVSAAPVSPAVDAAAPAESEPVALAPVAPAPAEPAPVAAEPVVLAPAKPAPTEPAPPAAEPVLPPAHVEPAPVAAAPPLRRRAAPQPPKPPARPATIPATARSVTMLAGAALLLALTAPLLEDSVLGLFGIATPASRAQQEAALMLARQEQKLRDLEQRLAGATAQLAATRDDLQQSTQRRTDRTTWGAWGRLLSLGRVADALRGATPFASDLAVAQTVGAGIDEFKPELDKLSAYASTGVPTRTDIDREFLRITNDTLHVNGGILPSGLARRLDTLNPFTPGSPATPDPAPELVQAAAARLAEGDVEEAVARIRQVGGTYQSAYAGWLEDAQARVNADALVRRIDRTLAELARELPK